jgi:SlyX protein
MAELSGKELQEEVFKLQSKLAFQENMIEELNSVIISQQGRIEKTERNVERLKDQILNAEWLKENFNQKLEDEKPPHY